MMNTYLTQSETTIGPRLNGFGNLGNPSDAPTLFNSIITGAVGLLTIIGFIYFLFQLITGAIGIIGSGGDKTAYEDARKKITQGLIGIIVIIGAIFIIDLVGEFLGLVDILDPGGLIDSLSP